MTSERLIMVIIAGAFGGVLRGLIGIAKSAVGKKSFQMNWPYFFMTVAIAAIVGTITATFFEEDLRLALLAGYAGSDIIEGLMKMKLKDKFLGGALGSVLNEKKEELVKPVPDKTAIESEK